MSEATAPQVEQALHDECADIMRHEDYGITPSDKAARLLDKLLAQIDEAYQDWQVDGGDVRDWVHQIEAVRALLSPTHNPDRNEAGE